MKSEPINNLCSRVGFTLVEIIVVAGIISFIASAMALNFSKFRSRSDLVSNELISYIRFAQTKALTGAKHENLLRCGYGIYFAQPDSSPRVRYAVYVGPAASSGNSFCTSFNRNYGSGEDTEILAKNLQNNYEFRTAWAGGQSGGIFFQPPNPTTYINNDSSLTQPAAAITIQPAGVNLSYCTDTATQNNCRTVCVYPSGKITAVIGASCP